MSPKQRAVLDLMRAGVPFRSAYDTVGLSQSYENMSAFLMRLVDSGYVVLVVSE